MAHAQASPSLEGLFQTGLALHQAGDLQSASDVYQQVLAAQPNHFNALNLLGTIACQSGEHERAIQLLHQALGVHPNHAPVHNNMGHSLNALGRFEEGVTCFQQAIALDPNYADAYYNWGIAEHALERWGEALACFDRAVEINPHFVQAIHNRGMTLCALQRWNEACASFQRAMALKPDYAEAWYQCGNSLYALQRFAEADVCYEKAIQCQPDFAEADNNRGLVLKALKRIDEALACYERAIALNPDFVEAHNNRGHALNDLKRFEEAIACYDRVLELKPDLADVYYNKAIALSGLNRLYDCIAAYQKAIELKPDFVAAYNHCAIALNAVKRPAEALVYFDRAIALEPEFHFLRGLTLHTRMYACDWAGFEQQLSEIEAGLALQRPVTYPFPLMGLSDRPELQRCAAEILVALEHPQDSSMGPLTPHTPNEKIRVAYYSADLHTHPVAYLMAQVFEAHDRERFEIFAFSFGPQIHDEMRARLVAAFDHFIDVSAMSDRQVAQLSRDLRVDIAVDLHGYTAGCRPGVFGLRCAPVQVNYLGYPGTSGAPYIDYILADEVVIDAENRMGFTEKIAWLPHCYQANDRTQHISERVYTREEMGLPAHGFVFCCFNNSWKLLPETFDSWMRILKAVPDSHLWLYEANPGMADNLRREARLRGVDAARLVFAQTMPLAEHLARLRLADLFLDTLPYNAGTTASNALWAGVPVLTLKGASFVGRMAASLLMALDLPELITPHRAAYEAQAIALAQAPEQLRALKNKLNDRRQTSRLFDGASFAEDLEAAFLVMHQRSQEGLAPQDFRLNASRA